MLQKHCISVALRCGVQRLTARIVPVQDAAPDVLCRFGKPKQIPIFQVDDTFVDEEIHIDGCDANNFRPPIQ